MSGLSCLSAEIAKPPVPWMPILPVSKVARKFAPVSAWALSGTSFSSHIALISVSTSLTPAPLSASSVPLAGSILDPAATIIGDVTKMLQPGQEPEK